MKTNETKTQSAVETVGLFCDNINQLKTATEDATRTVGWYGRSINIKQIKRFIYIERMAHNRDMPFRTNTHYFTKQIETTRRLIKRNQ
jgi:hypothetical protein